MLSYNDSVRGLLNPLTRSELQGSNSLRFAQKHSEVCDINLVAFYSNQVEI